MSLEDAPDRHLTRSEIYAKANYPQKTLPPKARPSKSQSVFELDTFSTDFKEHPVAYLIAKVLEQHNRDQFEVFGYSLHGSSSCKCDSGLKSRLIVLQMYKSMSDRDIALQARQDEIDIAVDLNGYTQYARLEFLPIELLPFRLTI